jgi:hypothetical protein
VVFGPEREAEGARPVDDLRDLLGSFSVPSEQPREVLLEALPRTREWWRDAPGKA